MRDEPWPHGGRLNLGAYGGTAEASKSVPPKPTPDLLVGETPGGLRATWEPNGNPAGTLYKAECWLGDDDGVAYGAGGTMVAETDYVADLLDHTFTGLNVNARYGVRIRAEADIPLEPESLWAYAGSAYSGAAPPPSGSLAARPDASIEANWAKGDNTDGTDYYCECWHDVAPAPPGPVANSGWTTAFQFTFTGLQAGEKYTVRVRARNKDEVPTDWTGLGWKIAILGPRPPVANDDTGSVAEDSADNVIDVLANDTDPNGDTLSVASVADPPHGEAVAAGTHVEYTPDPGHFGQDTFEYTVSDGNGGSDTATVSITVSSKWTLIIEAPAGSGSTNPATGSHRYLPGETVTVDATAAQGWAFSGWTGSVVPGGWSTASPIGFQAGDVGQSATLRAWFRSVDPVPQGDHHYLLVNDAAGIDWDEARIQATAMTHQGLAGHLATITSQAESDFIRDNVAPPAASSTPTTEIWIGGVQQPGGAEPGGGWAWVTGEAWSFENWWQGEPNDWEGPGSDDALMVWSLRGCEWNDIGRRNRLYYYIVEFEPGFTPPEAEDDTATVDEDSPDNLIEVLDNDSDDDGDPLEITDVSDPPHGDAVIVGEHIEYTPATDFPNHDPTGSDTFTYTISDGKGGSDTATVTVTVEPLPHWSLEVQAPWGSGSTAPTTGTHVVLSGGSALVEATAAADSVFYRWVGDAVPAGQEKANPLTVPPAPEDDTKTLKAVFLSTEPLLFAGHHYQLVIPPGGATWDEAKPLAESATHQGLHGHLATITGQAEQEFIRDSLAPPPEASQHFPKMVIGGYQLPGSAEPAEGWSWITAEPWGYEHWRPNTPDNWIYAGANEDCLMMWPHEGCVWDDVPRRDRVEFYIVEHDPDISPPDAVDDTASVQEDSPDNPIDVLGNDTDPEDDPLQLVSVSDPPHGTAEMVGDQIRYSPDLDFPGAEASDTDTFTYTITDGHGGFDSATVTVTVTNVSDPPDAADDTVEIETSSAGNVLTVLDNDTDPDGDTLTITDITQPGHGGASFTASQITYTPTAGYDGPDEITYDVSDGNGGVDTATVSIAVGEFTTWTLVVTEPDGSGSTNPAAGSYSYGVGQGASVQATADADSLFLYWTGDAVPSGQERSNPLAVPSAAGGETRTLAAVCLDVSVKEYNGHWYQLVYRPGRISWDSAKTEAETMSHQGGPGSLVTLTSQAENDWVWHNAAPPAESHAILSADVHIGAYQPPGSPEPAGGWTWVTGEAWSFTNWWVGEPNNGNGGTEHCAAMLPHADGKWNDIPGSLRFYYYVVEYDPGQQNGPPVAEDDFVTVAEDSTANTIAVLTNDSDPDGDPLTIESVTDPPHGEAAIVGDHIEYTPDPNYPNPDDGGQDAFDYTIEDGRGGSATATVTVTVLNVNDPPTAVDDSDAESPVNGRDVEIDVLANDGDADGDTLTLLSAADPPHGTAVINGNLVEYTPDAGYEGTDTFDYTVGDGTGQSAATITVTVAGQVGWAYTIQVLRADGSPWNAAGWTLGMHDQATDGYDEGLDVLAPFPSPDGTAVAFVTGSGIGPLERLQTDLRAHRPADLWKLVVVSWASENWEITWDPDAAPPGMPWPTVIQQVDEDWQPMGDPVNMSTTDHATIVNPTGDLYTSRWIIRFGPQFIDVDLTIGWNLVSVPVDPDDPNPASVFPGCLVYAYNAVTQSYFTPIRCIPGIGYWVCAIDDGDIWPPPPPMASGVALMSAPSVHWDYTFQVLKGDGTPWNQDGWTLGTQDGATDGLDVGIDNPAPPGKQDLSRAWLEIGNGLTDLDKLQTDLRDPADPEPQWKLRLQIPANKTWRISWNPASIPTAVQALTLTPTDSSWQPDGAAINMRQGSFLDVANPSGSVATRRFLIDTGGYNLPPSGFAAATLTDATITWTWTDNTDAETQFRIDPPGQDVGPNTTTWLESGLTPNTLYSRSVVAIIGATGETAPSNIDGAYTLAQQPPGGDVTVVSSTRIDAGWLAGNNPDGTQYSCECYEGDAIEPAALEGSSGWTPDTAFTFDGLSPNTLYTFRACARNHENDETDWTLLGSGSVYTRANVVGDVSIDTRVFMGPGLNLTAPSCNAVTFLDVGLNGNPASTEIAIRLGDGPGAKWLQFGRGQPLTDTDRVFAVSDQPRWHIAAEWAGRRVCALPADSECVFYGWTRDGSGQTSPLRQIGVCRTSRDGDVNRSGAVTALDYAYVRVAILRGGIPGMSCSHACDVFGAGGIADGAVDVLDLNAVRDRALNPGP